MVSKKRMLIGVFLVTVVLAMAMMPVVTSSLSKPKASPLYMVRTKMAIGEKFDLKMTFLKKDAKTLFNDLK